MNLKLALEKLNRHSKMRKLIIDYGPPYFEPKNDYFQSLLYSIVSQQLSGKVANIIYQRLIDLIPDNRIVPKEILILTNKNMRQAGLSTQKINYIKNLAIFFENNLFNRDMVEKMSNEEISAKLIQIKGIGQWTVDMFLMFALNRPDIMPYSDLGIQKGIKTLFDLDEMPTKNEMETMSEKWKPYRTVACWYLWKVSDNNIKKSLS
tara:strand:+ start:1097 stop:1714 length:618 start_codon:yes stop_codon:yes gene_type:complete